MSWISYLCENNLKDELIEEVGVDYANGFLEAHKQMRKRKNEPAFKPPYSLRSITVFSVSPDSLSAGKYLSLLNRIFCIQLFCRCPLLRFSSLAACFYFLCCIFIFVFDLLLFYYFIISLFYYVMI